LPHPFEEKAGAVVCPKLFDVIITVHCAKIAAERYPALSLNVEEIDERRIIPAKQHSPNSRRHRDDARGADMALSEAQIRQLAGRLDIAEKARTQIRQFSLEYPDITIEDAYAVQRAWVAMKIARGRSLKGHKIGLTSRAMQRSFNIDEPDYGALLDDMFFENGGDVPIERFIVPRVEVELAFVLKHRLSGPNCTIDDVLATTDYIVPAVEIIDARIHPIDPETKVTGKVVDTIADNAASAGLVLGSHPCGPEATDRRRIAALLYRNGIIEESGVAAAVLDDPANGPAWLANKLYPYGEVLEPGEVILGGPFTAAVPARAGDNFHIDYGPLGSISCRFVKNSAR
jgi:2-oxo-hept-3-ene-1,7-dioate hydratase